MKSIFVGALSGLIVVLILLTLIPVQEYRVYDCGMAEWHPDIPKEVKEECRRRALERRQEQQNKTVI